jgi:hypothetical protein
MGHGTDMVFVGVGDENRLDLVAAFFKPGDLSGMIRSTPGLVSMSGKATPRSTTISRSLPGFPYP